MKINKESTIMVGFINNRISLENMSLDIWAVALLNLLFCAILISPLMVARAIG